MIGFSFKPIIFVCELGKIRIYRISSGLISAKPVSGSALRNCEGMLCPVAFIKSFVGRCFAEKLPSRTKLIQIHIG